MDYQGQNVGQYFSLFVSYTYKWISNPQPYPPPYSYKQTLLLQAGGAIWTKTQAWLGHMEQLDQL